MTTADIELMESVKEFLKYASENDVYDESADDGDGHIDTWTSCKFDAIMSKMRLAVQSKEKEITK